jgi:hypothetical protein
MEPSVIEIVLKDFFLETENGYHHHRCNQIIDDYHQKAEKNRANGQKGGRPKKHIMKQHKPTGIPLGTQQKPNDNPNQSQNNLNHKPLTIKPLCNTLLPKSFLNSAFREEATNFADWFEAECKPENLKTTPRILETWALEWCRIREIDKRENVDEILNTIKWARTDPFWSTNFMTPLKLRKKNSEGVMYLDVLIAKYTQETNHQKINGTTQRRNGRLEYQQPFSAEDIPDFIDRIQNDPRLAD